MINREMSAMGSIMRKIQALLLAIGLSMVCGIGAAAEPQSVEDALHWLRAKSHEMIRASRRSMADGVAAFPPQVGGGYEAFWLRDFEYMLEGCADAFTDKELTDACWLFVKAQRADGACVDCVRFNGMRCYRPGYDTMGENPVADGSQFTVSVAWRTYARTKDRAMLQKIVERLVKAMDVVPRDPRNGLVYIKPGGYDR